MLEDIADHLGQNDDFAIFSIGAAGDLVADIAEKQDYLWAIERAKANAMLLSGGGNDLFGDLGKVLLGYFPGATPVELIDAAAFDPLFDRVIGSYRKSCWTLPRRIRTLSSSATVMICRFHWTRETGLARLSKTKPFLSTSDAKSSGC